MVITLSSKELEDAVLKYVNSLGVVTGGKDLSVYIEKDFGHATARVTVRESEEA